MQHTILKVSRINNEFFHDLEYTKFRESLALSRELVRGSTNRRSAKIAIRKRYLLSARRGKSGYPDMFARRRYEQ